MMLNNNKKMLEDFLSNYYNSDYTVVMYDGYIFPTWADFVRYYNRIYNKINNFIILLCSSLMASVYTYLYSMDKIIFNCQFICWFTMSIVFALCCICFLIEKHIKWYNNKAKFLAFRKAYRVSEELIIYNTFNVARCRHEYYALLHELPIEMPLFIDFQKLISFYQEKEEVEKLEMLKIQNLFEKAAEYKKLT